LSPNTDSSSTAGSMLLCSFLKLTLVTLYEAGWRSHSKHIIMDRFLYTALS
jgi:hypothetical protein